MNSKITIAALSLVVLSQVGCESDRSKPPGVFPQGARKTLVPERPLTVEQILQRAAAQPPQPVEGAGWQSLFDGTTLTGWRLPGFAGAGAVECQQGMLLCWMGEPFTGLRCTNSVPTMNYEISLEAMRVNGTDFFCGLTVPVRDSHCSLIVGGWGGSLVGISSIDSQDASENETTQFVSFESGRWYRIRLRVTEPKIEAWIEQKKVVDVMISGRKLSLRAGDIERSKPLGLTCWTTSAAYRAIKIRSVAEPADPGDRQSP